MAFLSPSELTTIGFRRVGCNVRISECASIYGAEKISIGNNVRIDDFCILSAGRGGISLGDFIHIAAGSYLIGHEQIALGDFANVSSRVCIYSSSDDYSGKTMTSPQVDERFKNVDSRPVEIGRHVIIGSSSVILPGSVLRDGVAVGALSLINGECKEFCIYAGVPAKLLKQRSRALLDQERAYRATVAKRL